MLAVGLGLLLMMATTGNFNLRDIATNLLAGIAIAFPTVFVFQDIIAREQKDRREAEEAAHETILETRRKVLNFQALNLVLSDIEWVGLGLRQSKSARHGRLSEQLPHMRRRAGDVKGKAYAFSQVLPFEVTMRHDTV